ncbi:pentapeptide repeat-containing protein [Lysinibacillus agricola]|uniref:pentapeptide repeat-containing protein n=1 Tax=Lysinibacillus agricola TaxID=2590012 RepID=UPI003C1E040D
MACLFDETDFRETTLHNANISLASFDRALLKGTKLTGIRGLRGSFIKSINVGTHEHPIILVGEEARQWLQKNSSGIETS